MKHLTKDDRNEICILLHKGYSLRDIARALDKSPSTISREVKRNKVLGEYISDKAQHKYRVRLKSRKKQLKKIRENTDLETYIHLQLKE